MSNQQGVVIMLMLLILILGSATLMLKQLNKGQPTLPNAAAAHRELSLVRDALIGFANINGGCLPCPSLNPTSGVAPANCTNASRVGYLPWQTIGLGHADHWQHRYRYSVDPDFADNGCVGLTLSTTGDIRVRTRNAAGALVNVVTNQPALVLSHGANGFGARNPDGSAMTNPPGTHIDENTNRTASTDFIQRAGNLTPGIAGGPFDDQLVWLPLNEVIAQADNANTPPGLPP